jgi:hypothetical protein
MGRGGNVLKLDEKKTQTEAILRNERKRAF